MTITLYRNTSPVNAVRKNLSLVKSFSNVTNIDNLDILNPVIIVDYSITIPTVNYMYIADFRRYYFIDNIELMSGQRVKITAHVDVLHTYSTANTLEIIQHTKARVIRSESANGGKIGLFPDNNLNLSPVQNISTAIDTKNSIFNTNDNTNIARYVLTVAAR